MQGWLNWQHSFKRMMVMTTKNLIKAAHMIHKLHHMIQDISVSEAQVISITASIQGHGLVVVMNHVIGDQLVTTLIIQVPALVMENILTGMIGTAHDPINTTNPDHGHEVMTRSTSININTNINTHRIDHCFIM